MEITLMKACVCLDVCVCGCARACVCEQERESEREREKKTHFNDSCFSRKEVKNLFVTNISPNEMCAAGLLMKHSESTSALTTPGSAAGDLASGRAFDSGCKCMQSSEAVLNNLTGRHTHCQCNVSERERERERERVYV